MVVAVYSEKRVAIMRLAHPPLKDYKGLITPSGPITTLPELDDWILEVTREHQIRDGCGRWLAIGADCSLPGRVGSSLNLIVQVRLVTPPRSKYEQGT